MLKYRGNFGDESLHTQESACRGRKATTKANASLSRKCRIRIYAFGASASLSRWSCISLVALQLIPPVVELTGRGTFPALESGVWSKAVVNSSIRSRPLCLTLFILHLTRFYPYSTSLVSAQGFLISNMAEKGRRQQPGFACEDIGGARHGATAHDPCVDSAWKQGRSVSFSTRSSRGVRRRGSSMRCGHRLVGSSQCFMPSTFSPPVFSHLVSFH